MKKSLLLGLLPLMGASIVSVAFATVSCGTAASSGNEVENKPTNPNPGDNNGDNNTGQPTNPENPGPGEPQKPEQPTPDDSSTNLIKTEFIDESTASWGQATTKFTNWVIWGVIDKKQSIIEFLNSKGYNNLSINNNLDVVTESIKVVDGKITKLDVKFYTRAHWGYNTYTEDISSLFSQYEIYLNGQKANI